MNILLKERETEYYLADSGAKALFAWHEFTSVARTGAEQAGAACIVVEPDAFNGLPIPASGTYSRQTRGRRP